MAPREHLGIYRLPPLPLATHPIPRCRRSSAKVPPPADSGIPRPSPGLEPLRRRQPPYTSGGLGGGAGARARAQGWNKMRSLRPAADQEGESRAHAPSPAPSKASRSGPSSKMALDPLGSAAPKAYGQAFPVFLVEAGDGRGHSPSRLANLSRGRLARLGQELQTFCTGDAVPSGRRRKEAQPARPLVSPSHDLYVIGTTSAQGKACRTVHVPRGRHEPIHGSDSSHLQQHRSRLMRHARPVGLGTDRQRSMSMASRLPADPTRARVMCRSDFSPSALHGPAFAAASLHISIPDDCRSKQPGRVKATTGRGTITCSSSPASLPFSPLHLPLPAPSLQRDYTIRTLENSLNKDSKIPPWAIFIFASP
ncbi:hypothetical protein CDD83_1448 [Cordyceps sp. RAO-2017]|nr:hypothetical protein CDD83_1448 [Cordyceps sp. RAO-2017]